MKFVKNSLISASSLLAGGFLYANYLVHKNHRDYEQIMDEDSMDTTRPTNDNFGINWGYKADLMIMEKIDSGDVIFVKYDCDKCINLKDMGTCYLNQMKQTNDTHYDSAGVAVRNLENVHVLYQETGKAKSDTYSNFISRPYVESVTLRKLKILKDQKNSEEFSN